MNLYIEPRLSTGKTIISNDGATIMKQLDIVHPAARTLVDIAKSQDSEVRTLQFVGSLMMRRLVFEVCPFASKVSPPRAYAFLVLFRSGMERHRLFCLPVNF